VRVKQKLPVCRELQPRGINVSLKEEMFVIVENQNRDTTKRTAGEKDGVGPRRLGGGGR